MRDQELKYILPREAKTSLLNSLAFCCVEDGEYAFNTVNSLYFDTSDYLFAMEKASSDYNKSKVRIRWYTSDSDNASSLSECYLEFKRKIGSSREKIRVPILDDHRQLYSELKSGALMQRIKECIAKHSPELAALDLKPAFQISYQRHRFVDVFSNSRIACDTDITAIPYELGYPFVLAKSTLAEIVLEVKGDSHELPTALRSLSFKGLKKAAFSKYYENFCLLTDYQQ